MAAELERQVVDLDAQGAEVTQETQTGKVAMARSDFEPAPSRNQHIRYTDKHNMFTRLQRTDVKTTPQWIYPDLLLMPQGDDQEPIPCNGYMLLVRRRTPLACVPFS